MITTNTTIQEMAALLKAAPAVLIYCHHRPDGDTIGSAMALKAALAGTPVEIVTPDPIPNYIRFLCGGRTDFTKAALPAGFLAREGLLRVALDVADVPMLGAYAEDAPLVDLRIDHHIPRNLTLGKQYYIDPDAPACGQILYHLLVEMNAIDRRTAEPLYAALSSDTGGFRYANTTAETLEIAAVLTRTGISTFRINHALYCNRTKGEIRAQKLALESLSYYDGGKVAVIAIDAAAKAAAEVTDEDLGDISRLPREIEGVELGITIRQLGDSTTYKISMRAGETIDASALCGLFGGGGHKGAAGASVEADSLTEAKTRVVNAVLEALHG